MFRNLTVTFLYLCISATYVNAADDKESYAIKGAGVSFCSRFVQSVDSKDEAYLVYGGWVEGYLTALNQQLSNTFDLAPWQSTGLLLNALSENCRQNAGIQFHQVVKAMAAELNKQKLVQGGQYVQIEGEKKIVLDENIIRRIKQRLTQKGFHDGDDSTNWDKDTQAALTKFQDTQELPKTGFPDQATLYLLFADSK